MEPLPSENARRMAGPLQLATRLLGSLESLAVLRSLLELGNSCRNEHALLGQTATLLTQHQDINRCSIFLVRDRRLVCAAGSGLDDHPERMPARRRTRAFPIGEGIAGAAARTRSLIHAPDCRKDPRYVPASRTHRETEPGAIICAPLVQREELLGVLNVSHPRPGGLHAWLEHDIAIHAALLSQVLHHHRLLAQDRGYSS